ncbi:MAG TPA: sugar phosphate isomerase/epimerase family protein [Roseiflexaceae bacterium]
MAFGIAAYSFPCSCGFAQRNGRPASARPMKVWDLIALAAEYGLNSVEIPLQGMLPDLAVDTIDRLREELASRGLTLIVDSGPVDVEMLGALFPLAARAGARIVRATLSTILEGARAGVPGGWDAYLQEMRRRVVALRPALEEHGLILALENHQDATSDDLLSLCEAGGARVGVTFDVVNPLAVGEEPFAFARKLGSLIRNVHIKDYQIFPTESGYRLVRCAIGQGVIAWPEMFALLREVAPDATQQIELAALYARHIRLLEDDWWGGFPPRDVREVVPALRLLTRHAHPANEPWQTPWELEASSEEVERWERDQFEASVGYLRSIGA